MLEETRSTAFSILAVLLAPVIVKSHLILGLLDPDPLLLWSNLGHDLRDGWLTGFPTIDPNIAYTGHALGYRATLDLFSGRLPWWNHFEGVGAPLAGEMQSAAFFPLAWLLILHNGQLYMHLALQVIAGLSTWALLRRLDCSALGALTGALAFEFNGTYAWLANAVINPIAFLPVALFGVETLRSHVLVQRPSGAVWLTIGLAASLYSGFPEVAYIDGLLILLWTLTRTATLPRGLRWSFLCRVSVAGLAALALAAPILLAFFDYLPLADTGIHDTGFAGVHLAAAWLVSTFVPYAFGGIFEDPKFNNFWGSLGGYAGCSLLVVAMSGVFGTTLRELRIALASWVAISFALSYGVPGFTWLLHVVPGLKWIAFHRYLPPSWEFALCVLAALGLTDLARAGTPNRVGAATAFVFAACLTSVAIVKLSRLHVAGLFAHADWLFAATVMCSLAAIAGLMRSRSTQAVGLSLMVVVEAVCYFVVPTLSYRSSGTVELAGIGFLKAHLGLQRVTSIGPLSPNYGSYFGIAQVNHNDLPIPRDWTTYLRTHLDHNADPILFTGGNSVDPGGPSGLSQIVDNIQAFEHVGVRYLLVPPNALANPDFGPLKRYLEQRRSDLQTPVFSDPVMEIYEFLNPRPYFSAPGCRLTPVNRNKVEADCPEPATFTRLELFMPGWQALIDGKTALLKRTDEIFQQLSLPAGRSTIRFRFVPPYMPFAYLLFLAGLGMLILQAIGRRGFLGNARPASRI